MTVRELDLQGVLLIEADIYRDDRGYFAEVWNEETYRKHGLDVEFVQDNLSYSRRHVLRGLHFQNPHAQGKLVSVPKGEIFDVAVDIRPDSDTFQQWVGVTLSSESGDQLYVPEGFAHGFVVLSESAVFHYKCTDRYYPAGEGIIRWDDPEIGIDWPISDPILSERDAEAPVLGEVVDQRRLAF